MNGSKSMVEAEPITRHFLTVTVDAITGHDEGARLSGHSSIGEVAIVVPSRPDVRGAKRLAGAVRQIDRVEVHLQEGAVDCHARGRSSRLPFARSLPLAIGLGLGLLGVPMVVTGVER